MRRGDSSEGGFVMVAVMVVMGFALILAGVAVAGTVQARSNAVRDVRAKRAQQAADAGLSATIYRLNQLSLANVDFSGGLSRVSQAVACQGLLRFGTSVDVGFADVEAGTGVCGAGKPAVPKGKFFDERLGDQTRATGYVTIGPRAIASNVASLAPTRLNPVVVSVGRDDAGTPADASDDVIRRVRATLKPIMPFKAIEATGNLTFDTKGLVTTTTLNGSALTNGDLAFNGSTLAANTFVNSDVSVLPLNVTGAVAYQGNRPPPSGLVSVSVATLTKTTEPPVSRTPVSIAAAKPDCPATGCPAQYTAANHYLVASSGTVTLAAGDYVFCKVAITGSAALKPAPTASKPVRIFVDHPKSARCLGNAADPTNGYITINGTGGINPGSVSLQPSQLQIYTVGPPAGVAETAPLTVATFDTSKSAAALNLLPGFFFYGPTTDVKLRYSTFTGNLVGRDITLTAAGDVLNVLGVSTATLGTFTQDLNVNNLPLTAQLDIFSVAEYGECSANDVTLTTSTNDC